MKYAVGLAFEADQARGVLLEAYTGQALAECSSAYAQGPMVQSLKDPAPASEGRAVQDADTYLEAALTILQVLVSAVPQGKQVVAIGVACPADHLLTCRADGTPLSRLYPDQPDAYMQRPSPPAAEPWRPFGAASHGRGTTGTVPSITRPAPEVWTHPTTVLDVGDWLVWQLSGRRTSSASLAAARAHLQQHPVRPQPLSGALAPSRPGSAVGALRPYWVHRLGLRHAPVMAPAVADVHAAVPGVGVGQPNTVVSVLGRGACHLTLTAHGTEGGGPLRGCVLPDWWSAEVWQRPFGDLLSTFMTSPAARGAPHRTLDDWFHAVAEYPPGTFSLAMADQLPDAAGTSGPPLLDAAQRATGPAPSIMFHALLEALAFETRRLTQALQPPEREAGRFIMTGALALRHPVLMQLMADVCARPVAAAQTPCAPARGAAIHAVVATQSYGTFPEVIRAYQLVQGPLFTPQVRSQVYDELYHQFRATPQDAILPRFTAWFGPKDV